MNAWILNLDTEPSRWLSTRQQCERFGLAPQRFTATPGTTHLPRRQAIVHSYRRLLEHLATTDDEAWMLLQDDAIIHTLPAPQSRLHIYGGWRSRRPIHVCPQAFYLHRDLLQPLQDCWTQSDSQVCHTWAPLLDTHATFESVPTIVTP